MTFYILVRVKGDVLATKENNSTPKVDSPFPSSPKQANSPTKARVQRVHKNLPAHIKTMNSNIAIDILTNKIPQKKADDQPYSIEIMPYDVIEKIDEQYKKMVSKFHSVLVIYQIHVHFMYHRFLSWKENRLLGLVWKGCESEDLGLYAG